MKSPSEDGDGDIETGLEVVGDLMKLLGGARLPEGVVRPDALEENPKVDDGRLRLRPDSRFGDKDPAGAGGPLFLRCTIVKEKMAWLREEDEFIPVAPVLRRADPSYR